MPFPKYALTILAFTLPVSNAFALIPDVGDLLGSAKIAASQFPRAAAAIEASRTLTSGTATGVNVNILERRQNLFVATNFNCPYAEGSMQVENCNGSPLGNNSNLASLISALDELPESAREAQLDPAHITFAKAWAVNQRIFVRATYASPTLGNGNAVFSCHNTSHGNEAPHMHCHFNSANPVGPNEPFASSRP